MTDDHEQIAARLAAIRERCEKATPGPWRVWGGPEYCGGGADLCIGAGDSWIANMDHRYGADHDKRVLHNPDAHGDDQLPDCPICSMNEEVTAEQAATADFIAASRADIPWLLGCITALKKENKQMDVMRKDALDLADDVRADVGKLEAENAKLRAALQYQAGVMVDIARRALDAGEEG